MPTYLINNHQEFLDLVKWIDDFKRYNVTIRSVEVKSGFTEQQRKELTEIVASTIATMVPQIIATTVPPLIEAAVAPLRQDIVEIKQDIVELKKDVAELRKDVNLIMSLPTIKREIAELESNK